MTKKQIEELSTEIEEASYFKSIPTWSIVLLVIVLMIICGCYFMKIKKEKDKMKAKTQ